MPGASEAPRAESQPLMPDSLSELLEAAARQRWKRRRSYCGRRCRAADRRWLQASRRLNISTKEGPMRPQTLAASSDGWKPTS